MAALRRVLDRYGAAGGGLLAGGLAYAALFAIVPAVVLMAGVVGLIVADPADRAELVATLAGVLPPLRDLIEVVLTEAARDAAPVSIFGAVTLIWGTSRFAVAFEDSIARVMGGDASRGMIATNVGALVAVVVLIGAIVASTLLSGVVAFLEAGEELGVLQLVGTALTLALGVAPVVATIGAMILVYRIVPAAPPPWRAVLIPSVVIGLVVTFVARLFASLAPLLIGAAALLGTLVTAFVALAWLSLSFQAILLGSAWVRDRAERAIPPGARPIDSLGSRSDGRSSSAAP